LLNEISGHPVAPKTFIHVFVGDEAGPSKPPFAAFVQGQPHPLIIVVRDMIKVGFLKGKPDRDHAEFFPQKIKPRFSVWIKRSDEHTMNIASLQDLADTLRGEPGRNAEFFQLVTVGLGLVQRTIVIQEKGVMPPRYSGWIIDQVCKRGMRMEVGVHPLAKGHACGNQRIHDIAMLLRQAKYLLSCPWCNADAVAQGKAYGRMIDTRDLRQIAHGHHFFGRRHDEGDSIWSWAFRSTIIAQPVVYEKGKRFG